MKVSQTSFSYYFRQRIRWQLKRSNSVQKHRYLNSLTMSTTSLPRIIKRNTTKNNDDTASDNSFKKIYFKEVCNYLKEGEETGPALNYVLEVVECLYFTWFLIHPSLNIYAEESFLLSPLLLVLKIFNFQELLSSYPKYYSLMILASFAVLAVLYTVNFLAIFLKLEQTNTTIHKYIRKFLNYANLIMVKVLCGPFIGLSINILYCNSANPYHNSQQCYTPQYLGYCGIAALVLLTSIFLSTEFSLFFYIKNPIPGFYMGYPNRFYYLSKTILKIIFPLYFALSVSLGLEFLYIIFLPAIWGAYIFFHRISSLHSYNNRHFYVELYLEGFLLWMAFSTLLSYNISGTPNPHSLSLIYSLVCSLLAGLILVHLQKKLTRLFIQQCLQGKVKKQNIQRFMNYLIHELLHVPSEEMEKQYKVYSKMITHNTPEVILPRLTEREGKTKEDILKENIMSFLLGLTNRFLEEGNIFSLKLIKCQLLNLLGSNYYSFHQGLELGQQKLSIFDEFSLFYFLEGFDELKRGKNRSSLDLVKAFMYQQSSNHHQELMESCAENNGQFWYELGESFPSVPKLRNLATQYVDFTREIAEAYLQIKTISPQSVIPTMNYLHFLLQVGANLSQTVRVRDQLKNKIQALGNNHRLPVDEVTAVALDTVGNKLGQIISTNSQIKDLLGFEKNTLIGKNVIKLMPKIYSELHNSFIISFIKRCREDNSLQDSQYESKAAYKEKLVVALNNESYLIQVGLRLQIIATSKNSLMIVGFLRKMDSENQGLIMLEATTGQILGINKPFASLIRNKISGKQVVQQDMRMYTLLPEINLSLMQKQGFQDTVLESGHISDEESLKNRFVNVRLRIKHNKNYQGHQLAFISIYDKQSLKSNQLVSFNRRRSSTSNRNLEVDLKSLPSKDLSSKQIIQSINCSEVTTYMEEKGAQELIKEVPLSRKLSQFIEVREKVQYGCCIKVFNLLMAICSCSFLVAVLLFENAYLNRASSMYSQLQLIIDIPYEVAQISLYTNRIWSVNAKTFQTQNFTQFYEPLKKATDQLSNSFLTVTQSLSRQSYPLQYNQPTYYPFSIQKIVDGTYLQQQLTFTNLDGISYYINSAKQMYDPLLMSSPQPPNTYRIHQEAYFISTNANAPLPDITSRAINSYRQFFEDITGRQSNLQMYLKAGIMLTTVAYLIVNVVLCRAISRTSIQISGLYSKLRLWQINQMVTKCDQFLSKRGKVIKQKRKSSLLRIFPIRTFVEIVTPTLKKPTGEKQNRGKIQRLKEEEEEEMSILKNDLQADKCQVEGGYVPQPNDPRVHLQQQSNPKASTVIVYFLLLTVILATTLMLSVYWHYDTCQDLKQRFKFLTNVGVVRTSLTYINLFTFSTVSLEPEYGYSSLLLKHIAKFYAYSSITYSALGDAIFKDVYGLMEVISKQFASYPITEPKEHLVEHYPQINEFFQTSCQKIVDMVDTTFQADFNARLSSASQLNFIVFLITLGASLTAILFVHFAFLSPMDKHRRQAINMLKILPAWVVRRSPEAYQIMSKSSH